MCYAKYHVSLYIFILRSSTYKFSNLQNRKKYTRNIEILSIGRNWKHDSRMKRASLAHSNFSYLLDCWEHLLPRTAIHIHVIHDSTFDENRKFWNSHHNLNIKTLFKCHTLCKTWELVCINHYIQNTKAMKLFICNSKVREANSNAYLKLKFNSQRVLLKCWTASSNMLSRFRKHC